MSPSTETAPARVPGAHRRQRLSRLDSAGRFCARNARIVGAVWLVAVVLAFALAAGVFGTGSLFERLTSGAPNVAGDARDALDLIGDAEGTGGTTTLLLDRVDPSSAATEKGVEAAAKELRSDPDVLQVGTPYDGDAGRVLIASDKKALLVTVTLKPGLGEEGNEAARLAVEHDLLAIADQLPGSTAGVTSVERLVDAITGQIEVDLRTGEGIALPISLLVMALVFGGFIAAGMPIAGAIASIAGALASLFVFSTFLDLDATVVNVVSVLGLGLCIDYGLLMVSRFREEVRRDLEPGSQPDREQVIAAVGRTVATAGRTVLFSGITVTISVGGMLVFQAQILRAIGAASISVVVVAMLVAIFATPVMLALFGQRLVRPGSLHRVPGLRRMLRQLGDIAPVHGVFSRLGALVQRRPLRVGRGRGARAADVLPAVVQPAAHRIRRGPAPEGSAGPAGARGDRRPLSTGPGSRRPGGAPRRDERAGGRSTRRLQASSTGSAVSTRSVPSGLPTADRRSSSSRFAQVAIRWPTGRATSCRRSATIRRRD